MVGDPPDRWREVQGKSGLMPIKKHKNSKRRAEQNRAADDRRGSARERGYSTAWDKFARSWLIGNPLCVYCAAQGRDQAAEVVDHITPHRGDPTAFWPQPGDDWAAFFAASCRKCHDGPKQRAELYADRMGEDVRLILARRVMLPLDHPALNGIKFDRVTILRHDMAQRKRASSSE